MTSPAFSLRPEAEGDAAIIEAVLDEAFGPGRHARTAYRLREGIEYLPELAFVAENGGELIGSLRYWPIRIGGITDALLLGPLAIRPDWQGRGCGMALMKHTLALAKELGHRLVVLVGDPPYYARVGFTQIEVGRVTLPGPVDPARLLWLELVPGAGDGARGEIGKHPDFASADAEVNV
jgi:predicted N-acetyltransferase YhbS